MYKVKFLNKAISRIFSEILLVIILFSIISLTGLFSITYSKNLSYNPKIEIIEVRAIQWNEKTLIKMNIANIGNTKITLCAISVKGIGNIWIGSKNLEPSENYEIEAIIPYQEIGKKLTIIVGSIDQDGRTMETIASTVVMP
ncbi:MAG: hypothetical protein QXY18_03010 [Nitrososphaerota archaeon]